MSEREELREPFEQFIVRAGFTDWTRHEDGYLKPLVDRLWRAWRDAPAQVAPDLAGRWPVITLDDLKTNAKFRGIMFLDMAHSAYENHYQSQTYPRLVVIKAGSPRSPKVKQLHTTTYFVDGMECPDLDAVVTMLNTVAHPKRADLARHQDETTSPHPSQDGK